MKSVRKKTVASIYPKKSLGQNFLIDPRVLARIADALTITRDDWIIEIGAGRGELTRFLLRQNVRVLAIEIDPRFQPALKKLQTAFDSLEIIESDILELQLSDFKFARPIKIAGNIPYHLTSPIISWLIDQKEWIDSAVLLMQKEVARRVTAVSDNKDWCPIAIQVGIHFDAQKLFDVRPGSFYPRPKITSSLVRLQRLENPRIARERETGFMQIVHQAFAHRRKTALNSLRLSHQYHLADIHKAFKQLRLPLTIRAEQISFSQFVQLAECLPKPVLEQQTLRSNY